MCRKAHDQVRKPVFQINPVQNNHMMPHGKMFFLNRFEAGDLMLVSLHKTFVAVTLLGLVALTVLAAPEHASGQEQHTQPAAYETLADILENEQARNKLIQDLREMASRQGDQVAAGGPRARLPEKLSLPGRMANIVTDFVADIGTQFKTIASNLNGIVRTAPGDKAPFNLKTLGQATLNLGLVILTVIAAFFIFRRLARPFFSRLSSWARDGAGRNALLRLTGIVALAAAGDVLVVGAAYVTGNIIATFAVGESGALSTQVALFLNAFLLIELLKAGIRMLFSSRYDGLRLLPLASEHAAYWNCFFARLAGFVGYGMFFAVPLTSRNISHAAGQGVGLLIMLAAFVYATAVVLKNRIVVREGLSARAGKFSMGTSQVLLRVAAQTWHLLAIAYLVVVLLVTLIRPSDALPFVMLATLKSLIFIGGGVLVSGILSQFLGRRVTLSPDVRRKLPLLESRLNAYVPIVFNVGRTIIVLVAALFILDAWSMFDFSAWYSSTSGQNILSTGANVAVILLFSLGVWVSLASLIEHRLNSDTGTGAPTARAKTLLSLFRNVVAITITTITAMILLAEVGINIGPLIAGAGVLGLAIGFGAQKLVQDIITGVFIQVENAMNTGDVVTAGGITGVAERLSIRSVGLRDLSGTYHIVPFSSVDTVSNFMRDFAFHVGEYGIAYGEDIDEAVIHLRAAFDELAADPEYANEILEPLEVSGVTALADSSVNIRVRIKTNPGMQWSVGRAYNRLVKRHFDAAGIEIPFPHTTVYFGESKDGRTPAANLRMVQDTIGQGTQEKATEEVS